MKLRFAFGAVYVLILIFIFIGCESSLTTYEPPKQSEFVGPDLSVSVVDIQTFEQLCELSNTIVKAKYVGFEEFDDSTSIFKFEVENDFTKTIFDEETIHVYESEKSSFVEGKSYYLFLTGFRLAGYPHVVYGRLEKEFLLGEELASNGETLYTFYEGLDLGVKGVKDFNTYIKEEIIAKGLYVTKPTDLLPESLESAFTNSDVIALATVTEVEKWNKYISICLYEVDVVLKGDYVVKHHIPDELFGGAENAYQNQVLEVAGTFTPNTAASAETVVGDKLLLLFKYSENKELIMYSSEHYQYPADSDAARELLKMFE